ncbi:MAG: LptA/OstA family protein [Methyloceanibacter sp.]
MTAYRALSSYPGATGALAAIVMAVLLTTPLEAQTLTNSFGGLSQSSNEPIDIESDVLVVHDQQKYATFKGNVKAVQGTTTLRARELDVHYVGGGDKLTGEQPTQTAQQPAQTAATGSAPGDKPAAAAGAGSQTQITQIEAKGDVIINSAQDQTTTSDWALYDVPAQLVTVGGNVVLTQGQNVLKGDRLVIDLKTGESRFENPGTTTAGGRIRALFVPKAQDAKGKSNDAKPGETGAGAKPQEANSGEAASGAEAPDASPPEATESNDTAPQTSKPAQDDKPWSLIPGIAQ